MWVECINSNCGHQWNYRGQAQTTKCPKCKKNIKRQDLKKIKEPVPTNTVKTEDPKKEFGLLTGVEGGMGTGDEEEEDIPFFEVVEEQVEEIDEEGDEDQDVLSQAEWLDLVSTLNNDEYGELYQLLNDMLNDWLDTQRFDMTQKRTTILGKLTRKVLLLHKPKMKPLHLLGAVLALSYGKAGFELAKEKHAMAKAKTESEKHVKHQVITKDSVEVDDWVRGDGRQTITKRTRRKKPAPKKDVKKAIQEKYKEAKTKAKHKPSNRKGIAKQLKKKMNKKKSSKKKKR